MIRIDFHLHRTGQLRAVFLLIRCENRTQLCLQVRAQQRRFAFVQLQNRCAVAKRFKVLVAVQQPQAVRGCLIAISVVVAQLKFPERLIFLAQSHQSDSKRGMCGPQPWLKLDRFAVVGDCVLIPVVPFELTPDPSARLAVVRINGANLGEPGFGRTARDQFDRRMNGHRVQRVVF